MAKAMPDQKSGDAATAAANPLEFHVYGPRNLSSISWKDLLSSSWKNANYRRMVIACFIQGAYLLELDRQEKRDERTGLAPQWWRPFKYRLAQVLVDERDGSIYGAVLEWDHQAALSDYIPFRPTRARRRRRAARHAAQGAHSFDLMMNLYTKIW
ncbi:hypothetical protein TRIUR3_17278 [Triticum urartu]|uniref:Uncharacterized protein n=1 Tax=Triticum urartu TaxID=4572 RepID=M7ZIH6_TRIUA|nr:hypothetical protein TRIUR3_17278 [Triticum urartu]